MPADNFICTRPWFQSSAALPPRWRVESGSDSSNLEAVREGDDADDAAEAHLETTGVEIPYLAMESCK